MLITAWYNKTYLPSISRGSHPRTKNIVLWMVLMAIRNILKIVSNCMVYKCNCLTTVCGVEWVPGPHDGQLGVVLLDQ